MSKSRGTFIKARTYLDHLNPEYLRYYFAAKLGAEWTTSISTSKTSHSASTRTWWARSSTSPAAAPGSSASASRDACRRSSSSRQLFDEFVHAGGLIAEHYEQREFSRAVRLIMSLADSANQYIDERKPWVWPSRTARTLSCRRFCTMGINLFRLLIGYLRPILPGTAELSEAFLQIAPLCWSDLNTPLLDHQIAAFKPLLIRVDAQQIATMVEASKEDLKTAAAAPKDESPLARDPIGQTIEFPDFAKVDLRIVRIVKAEQVDGADKLLRLTLDLGGETRNVFAGIKAAYSPEELTGKLTVMVANLAPRKMKFGVSEGMVLAAGAGGEELFVLHPDAGAQPGMKVK